LILPELLHSNWKLFFEERSPFFSFLLKETLSFTPVLYCLVNRR
jgi:hypothetical protein